jgi:tetratricopeptide (TPR) repeat protein
MKLAIVLVLSLMLGACASAPVPPAAALFHDAAFAAPSERIDASATFALSPQMREFLDTRILPNVETHGRRGALMAAFHADGKLRLEYDAELTRNAAQAFDARSGNCLSLVLMTASFAKALGLSVRYQDVLIEETWGRDGDTYFSIGHVNVTLIDRGFGHDDAESTMDFLPPRDLRNQRTRVVGEQMVIAMYMNNRAVESLVRGRLDDAYSWARDAIVQEPRFLNASNTQGAVYERRGMATQAGTLFAYVLEREPRNLSVMSNLVATLNQQGRRAEASVWEHILQQRDPNPPFSYFKRGLEAMDAHDYARARDLFAREVDRSADYHEFHYWLARAYVGLGDLAQARTHLRIAMENSTTRRDHDIYAAKFAWLSAHAVR